VCGAPLLALFDNIRQAPTALLPPTKNPQPLSTTTPKSFWLFVVVVPPCPPPPPPFCQRCLRGGREWSIDITMTESSFNFEGGDTIFFFLSPFLVTLPSFLFDLSPYHPVSPPPSSSRTAFCRYTRSFVLRSPYQMPSDPRPSIALFLLV